MSKIAAVSVRHRGPRDRVGGIIVADEHILLIKRVRKDFGTYYVFPGGGIEAGEAQVAALRRELIEETGLRTKPERCVFSARSPSGGAQTFWLVRAPFKPVALPKNAEEADPVRIRERGTVAPMWIPLQKFSGLRVLPREVAQVVSVSLKYGFPKLNVELGVLSQKQKPRRKNTKQRS